MLKIDVQTFQEFNESTFKDISEEEVASLIEAFSVKLDAFNAQLALDEAKPDAKVLSKEDYHKVWSEKNFEKKKEIALELLSGLSFQTPSVKKAILAIKYAKTPTAVDFAITNISFAGEGLKTIKIGK
jgi:hypothetical protein